MTLSLLFLAAAGGVTGRAHRLAQRDGQDGYATVARPAVSAVVVTDGCGSGARSEVGARIGAAWLAALVETCFGDHDAAAAAREVTRQLIGRLGLLARSFHPRGDLDHAMIEEHLLFTFLVAAVTAREAIVFGIGDGLFVANDATTCLDPGPENAPPYAAYALLDPKAAEPTIHFSAPAGDVELLAVATDGLEPRAGELRTFASDPRLLKNPSLLRKRLVVLADEGVFHDDATLGVLRRLPS